MIINLGLRNEMKRQIKAVQMQPLVKTTFKTGLVALCAQLFGTTTDFWPTSRAEQNQAKPDAKLCRHTLFCL